MNDADMDNFDTLIGNTVANQYTLQRLTCRSRSLCLFEVSRQPATANAGFSRFGVKRSKGIEETPERGLLVIAEPETNDDLEGTLRYWQQWRLNADPSLIACHDAAAIVDGPLQGAVFAFTEFGVALGTAVNDEPLTRVELLRALRSVAKGLARVHDRGETHGGVTAWNIMSVDGEWKLSLGQCSGASCAADDMFALAVVFAVAITDRRNDHQYDPYGLPSNYVQALRNQLESDVEDPYRTLLLRCLDTRKESRPLASVLAEELMPLPEAVREIAVQRQGNKCALSWHAPACGDVRLVKASDVRAFHEGTLILASEIPAIGELLSTAEATSLEVAVEGNQAIAIVPVSERGPLAVVGRPLVIGALEDVTIHQVDVDRGEVVIQLRWPRNIQNALIVMRPDRYPEGPNDLHATTRPYPRGNKILQAVRIPVQSWDQAFISVYSFENIGDHLVYSPGMAENSRQRIDVASYRRITYSVIPRRSLPFAPSNLFDLRIVTDVEMDLPSLVLVGKRGRIPPVHRTDGVPLAVLSGGELCGPSSLQVELEGLERPFAVRLFPKDDKLAQWLQIRFASELVFA